MSAAATSDDPPVSGQPDLGYDDQGVGDPVVLVHGFTQTAGSWAALAARLAEHHRVLSVDAPGHGRSSAIAATLAAGAQLLSRLGTATWVGYSMGGRLCLHAALDHPQSCTKLVLVSTSAGLDDADVRQARRASDEILAQRLLDHGVEAFVDWWLTTPLFATLPADAAARDSRLDNTAAGLASSLRLAGAGAQEPLWHRLGELDMPVLVVTGALDQRYGELGERLVRDIGTNAVHRVIADAGHACHLEQPSAFLAVVEAFLAS